MLLDMVYDILNKRLPELIESMLKTYDYGEREGPFVLRAKLARVRNDLRLKFILARFHYKDDKYFTDVALRSTEEHSKTLLSHSYHNENVIRVYETINTDYIVDLLDGFAVALRKQYPSLLVPVDRQEPFSAIDSEGFHVGTMPVDGRLVYVPRNNHTYAVYMPNNLASMVDGMYKTEPVNLIALGGSPRRIYFYNDSTTKHVYTTHVKARYTIDELAAHRDDDLALAMYVNRILGYTLRRRNPNNYLNQLLFQMMAA